MLDSCWQYRESCPTKLDPFNRTSVTKLRGVVSRIEVLIWTSLADVFFSCIHNKMCERGRLSFSGGNSLPCGYYTIVS